MDKLNFANPSYNRDTGEASWSKLYFGSYPQAEVKGDRLVPAITQAEYDGNGDAFVDGIKYRRLKQKGDFHYFRWDKIQWRVLWNDGNSLFVISDKGLDCKEYSNTNKFVTWEHSSLRQWLANDFYNMAFNSKEQEVIMMHKTENIPAHPGSHQDGDARSNTSDKIYLVSVEELKTSAYGFWDEKVYWGHEIDKKINRRMKPTDYAQIRGVWTCGCGKMTWYGTINNSYKGNCRWWTRSVCNNTKYGGKIKENAKVSESGAVLKYYYGHDLEDAIAVVPVMHLDLERLTNITV